MRSEAGVGDMVEVGTEWGVITGTVVPRYQYDDDRHIVLKLPSGYNVGLSIDRLKGLTRKSSGEKPAFAPPPPPPSPKEDLPRVAILGTGGTIASRVDYRTGAVHPAISSEELYALIPELSEVARIEPEIIFSVYSENIEPENWSRIAERVSEAVAGGIDGVVITHGTDTLGYTAAALTFALQGVPIPVILTAAQRSSDRPSSDAVLNLVGAVSVAGYASFSGVYVAMHDSESDGRVALHLGTRVRKNHTSATLWSREGLEIHLEGLPQRRKAAKFSSKPRFEAKVALLKFFPSMPLTLLEALANGGTRGVVIEGTGLGHVNSKNIPFIRRFAEHGGLVCMASQCINGRVNMNVYDTGRDLLSAGVIPLEDMLAETALAKAMWVLANSNSIEEARSMMRASLCGEITERTLR
ncbi:MAG: Glu-tRNA(Gln) amidotransferase subunit GatD [Thaumarchaeota archaeon]|nr:MAG: Glu-tRNA(Gln) amidotransferase subunit GatD [Nitrososphaerota archaeon]